MSGNIVLSKSIHSNENLIPVENLSDGVYMVTIQNADYTFTKKGDYPKLEMLPRIS